MYNIGAAPSGTQVRIVALHVDEILVSFRQTLQGVPSALCVYRPLNALTLYLKDRKHGSAAMGALPVGGQSKLSARDSFGLALAAC